MSLGLSVFKGARLRLWLNALLKVAAGTYFVVTSLYCLLAFLPYTFCAFIRTPPYAWMPWLARHQAGLYWLAIAAGIGSGWTSQARGISKRAFAGIGLLFAGGVYLTWRPFLPGLQSNNAAYLWSLVALLPVLGFTVWQLSSATVERERSEEFRGIGISGGLLAALAISVIHTVGARVRTYSDTHSLRLQWQDAQLAFWSLATHFALAIVILTAVNLILLGSSKSGRPRVVRRALTLALIVVALTFTLSRFLNNAMSFDGWVAYLYAAALACTLTLWGFSLIEPFLGRARHGCADAGREAFFRSYFRTSHCNLDNDRTVHSAGVWLAMAHRRRRLERRG